MEKEEHKWGVKNDNKRKLAEIQALTDDIAMMKCTVSQLAATKRNQDEQDDDSPRNDAGNQFGGRKAKAGKWQLPSLFGTILSAYYAMYQLLTKRPRRLSRIVSSMRRRKKSKPGVNTTLPSHGRIELDSHLYLAQNVWSCTTRERIVKFHLIRMNTIQSQTSLSSEVPLCGRTSILTMNTSLYSMRLYRWVIPSLTH